MNMKANAKKTRTVSITTLGGALAAIGAIMMLDTSVAHADDYSYSPGSACATANGRSAAYVTADGAIGNRSTSSDLVVNCPFVLPSPSAGITGDVSVTKNSSATMRCALVTRNWTNTSGQIESQSLSGTGHKTFELHWINKDYFTSVRCNIPPAGSTGLSSVTWVNGYGVFY